MHPAAMVLAALLATAPAAVTIVPADAGGAAAVDHCAGGADTWGVALSIAASMESDGRLRVTRTICRARDWLGGDVDAVSLSGADAIHVWFGDDPPKAALDIPHAARGMPATIRLSDEPGWYESSFAIERPPNVFQDVPYLVTAEWSIVVHLAKGRDEPIVLRTARLVRLDGRDPRGHSRLDRLSVETCRDDSPIVAGLQLRISVVPLPAHAIRVTREICLASANRLALGTVAPENFHLTIRDSSGSVVERLTPPDRLIEVGHPDWVDEDDPSKRSSVDVPLNGPLAAGRPYVVSATWNIGVQVEGIGPVRDVALTSNPVYVTL